MFKRFQNDDRGVMLMVGVVGAAFLIGACWFVWGIGRATVFRENLQSAADSTAYLMSVYDARGMNIIAMINLIMSAVMAVLVIAKVVQAVAMVVDIIVCIVAIPICPESTAAVARITKFVDEAVAPPVRAVLIGLTATETAIAVAWPLIPATKSIGVAADYEPQALATVGIGMSNIPPVGDLALNVDELKDIGKNLSSGATGCGYSGEFFLPVKNDDFKNLCGRAGENIVHVFNLMFDKLAPVPDVIKGRVSDFFESVVAPEVGKLVSKVPQFFCMDTESGIESILSWLLGDSSDADEAADTCSKASDKKGGKGGGVDTAKPGKGACDKLKKPTAGEEGKGKGKGKGGWEALICTKKLSDSAEMLDDNFANWGFAMGQYKDVFQRPVEAATILQKNKTKVRAAAPANIQFAQSEFYYEPKKEGETKKEEADDLGPHNTMWNMRWRARLRRVRTPSVSLEHAGNAVVGKVGDLATSKLPGILAEPAKEAIEGFLGGAVTPLEGRSIPLGPGVSEEVIH